MNKKGIKIKRSKSLYLKKKSILRKALEIAGVIVLAGGLCMLGFAAGKPILDYFSLDRIDDGTVIWETEEQDKQTEESTETIETVPEEPGYDTEGLAFYAPTSALQNKAALAGNLISAKAEGYTRLVIDLKDSVGNIWYKSKSPRFEENDLIKGDLDLQEIMLTFMENEIQPIVRLSTLSDKSAPKLFDDMSYWFADKSFKWLDDRLENGGKLWADPTKPATSEYLTEIIKEIREAGFDEIILSNTTFPVMRPYDVSVLSDSVTGRGRYAALVDLVNDCADGQPLYLEMQLLDIVSNDGEFAGTAEVLRGRDSLSNVKIVTVYKKQEAGAELEFAETVGAGLTGDVEEEVVYLFGLAEKKLRGLEMIPCIDKEGLSDAETALAVDAAALAFPGQSVIIK
ncbi:MAG: putative glycoside hydrolase [Eubacterium sp.]|jgi:hypothetical protein|nr:putative glycoside hydrolase [Eubacterium sp.]